MALDDVADVADVADVDDVADVADVDRELVEGRPAPSQRVPLDRRRIVDTAIGYIDEHGLPALSMRRLGAELGVEAMSLYRYVPGRENLLDAVVERVVDSLREDPDVLDTPRDGWQDFLQRLAHGVRRIALTHPKVFPLVASRPPEAPWLRPPLRSLAWVEVFLDGLIADGFEDDAAVAAYRSFTSFLLGHLLLEVASLGGDVGPLDVLDDSEDANANANAKSIAPYPTVQRLSGPLAEDHAYAEFEEALEGLLDRIALMRAVGSAS